MVVSCFSCGPPFTVLHIRDARTVARLDDSSDMPIGPPPGPDYAAKIIEASRSRRSQLNLNMKISLDFSEPPPPPKPSTAEIRERQKQEKMSTIQQIVADVKARHHAEQRERNQLDTLDHGINSARARAAMHLELHRLITVHGEETMRQEHARLQAANAESAALAASEAARAMTPMHASLAAMESARKGRQTAWKQRKDNLGEVWGIEEWPRAEPVPSLPVPHPPAEGETKRAPRRPPKLRPMHGDESVGEALGATAIAALPPEQKALYEYMSEAEQAAFAGMSEEQRATFALMTPEERAQSLRLAGMRSSIPHSSLLSSATVAVKVSSPSSAPPAAASRSLPEGDLYDFLEAAGLGPEPAPANASALPLPLSPHLPRPHANRSKARQSARESPPMASSLPSSSTTKRPGSSPTKAHLRYLDIEQARGDIMTAYPTTIDPAKEEAKARLEKLSAARGVDSSRGGAADRPPFDERWIQLRAPDGGNLYAMLPPMVDGRLCETELGEDVATGTELHPAALLPTGTDFDDEPKLRAARLHATICHHLFAAPVLPAKDEAEGSAASEPALRTPLVVDGGDEAGLASLEAEVERLLCIAYSSHDHDAMSVLPMPVRGSRSAAAVQYDKSRGAGGPGGRPKPIPRPVPVSTEVVDPNAPPSEWLLTPEGYVGFTHGGTGLLSHIGKQVATSAAVIGLERGAVRAQIANARKEQEDANQKALEEAAARKAAKEAAEAAAAALARERLDDASRKRMQAVFDTLEMPVEDAITFATKYMDGGVVRREAFDEALPLWEEAAAAVSDFKKSGKKNDTERCFVAAEKLETKVGDTPTLGGVPFKEALGAS